MVALPLLQMLHGLDVNCHRNIILVSTDNASSQSHPAEIMLALVAAGSQHNGREMLLSCQLGMLLQAGDTLGRVNCIDPRESKPFAQPQLHRKDKVRDGVAVSTLHMRIVPLVVVMRCK